MGASHTAASRQAAAIQQEALAAGIKASGLGLDAEAIPPAPGLSPGAPGGWVGPPTGGWGGSAPRLGEEELAKLPAWMDLGKLDPRTVPVEEVKRIQEQFQKATLLPLNLES